MNENPHSAPRISRVVVTKNAPSNLAFGIYSSSVIHAVGMFKQLINLIPNDNQTIMFMAGSIDLVGFTRVYHKGFSFVVVSPPDEGNLPFVPAPGFAVSFFYNVERGLALIVIFRHTDFNVGACGIDERNDSHCNLACEEE
jgi:hypothetical protein